MSSRFSQGLNKLKSVAEPVSPAPAVPDQSASPGSRLDDDTKKTPRYVQDNRRGKVIISAYFDPAVRKQLAFLAVEKERTQADLIAEALNLLFEKYQRPPIAKA